MECHLLEQSLGVRAEGLLQEQKVVMPLMCGDRWHLAFP
jgi:hypothetical protein